jgi:hypothetical protein
MRSEIAQARLVSIAVTKHYKVLEAAREPRVMVFGWLVIVVVASIMAVRTGRDHKSREEQEYKLHVSRWSVIIRTEHKTRWGRRSCCWGDKTLLRTPYL